MHRFLPIVMNENKDFSILLSEAGLAPRSYARIYTICKDCHTNALKYESLSRIMEYWTWN
jgi:hypothetical protein